MALPWAAKKKPYLEVHNIPICLASSLDTLLSHILPSGKHSSARRKTRLRQKTGNSACLTGLGLVCFPPVSAWYWKLMQRRKMRVVVVGGHVFKTKMKWLNRKIRNVMGKLRNARQEMDCELASCHGGTVHIVYHHHCQRLRLMLKGTSIYNFVLKC